MVWTTKGGLHFNLMDHPWEQTLSDMVFLRTSGASFCQVTHIGVKETWFATPFVSFTLTCVT